MIVVPCASAARVAAVYKCTFVGGRLCGWHSDVWHAIHLTNCWPIVTARLIDNCIVIRRVGLVGSNMVFQISNIDVIVACSSNLGLLHSLARRSRWSVWFAFLLPGQSEGYKSVYIGIFGIPLHAEKTLPRSYFHEGVNFCLYAFVHTCVCACVYMYIWVCAWMSVYFNQSRKRTFSRRRSQGWLQQWCQPLQGQGG